ncbi:ecotropic viral integration site 5 protein homolog [Diadema antillarum]|uniref:ecotropic viral integration site 5 protein homolog n=1 Tax=Diadema antillarum TaxID=105358 RepID=UPI003A88AA30
MASSDVDRTSPPDISVTVPSPEEPAPGTRDLQRAVSSDGGPNGNASVSSSHGRQDSTHSVESGIHGLDSDGGGGDTASLEDGSGTLKANPKQRGRQSMDSLGATSQGSGDWDTSSLASEGSSPGGVALGKSGKIEVMRASTEEELLALMEEQNRLLESDSKSLKSISESVKSSRRGSNASQQSTSSSTSNLSNQALANSGGSGGTGGGGGGAGGEGAEGMSCQDQWLVWGKIVNDWEEYSRKKSKQLKDLVRLGIPHHFRGIAWQLLCGAYNSPLKEQYAQYLKMQSSYERVIRRDIARTYPEHEFFKEKDGLGQETLFNVMKAYSLHDREVGYCQGSAFIVGLLLMQMPEEEAFCVLVKLMQDYGMRELFKPNMAHLGLCMFQFECMIQDILPELYKHFIAQGFHTSMYASSWFLTLFAVCLPISLSMRIMDLFISEGMEAIFRIGVAILQLNCEDLLMLDMEEMLRFIQKLAPKIHEDEPEHLLQTSYLVKYNAKKMKRLEKDYFAFKEKETEEQIEMRRLRTENRLLHQRIQSLEKENELLADKLIQGQLTRAMEAEENYAIRRELEHTRNDRLAMSKELEGAQTVINDLREKTMERISQASARFKELLRRAKNEHTSVLDKEVESVVMELQDELISVRLKEAESAETLKVLNSKIDGLEKINKKLRKEPGHSVAALQDELIAVKLREAEANLSLKELREKVNDLETHWQRHLEKTLGKQKGTNNRPTVQQITEELMSVRLREADTAADLKETQQRVMELQTQNQMTSNQMRRIEEERLELKHDLEVSEKKEQELQSALYEAQKELCKLEARSKEEMINVRLREAEANAELIELRQRVADLGIKNEELMTKNTLIEAEGTHKFEELKDRIVELKREIAEMRKRERLRSGESRAAIEEEIEKDPELLQRERRVLEDEANQEEVMGIDISVIESDGDDDDAIPEIVDEEVDIAMRNTRKKKTSKESDDAGSPHANLERKESTV